MHMDVRFTAEAEEDLTRLYEFLLNSGEEGIVLAEGAFTALNRGLDYIAENPWGCRRAEGFATEFRELVISWGRTGYVLLYEIEAENLISILAARHQREQDWL